MGLIDDTSDASGDFVYADRITDAARVKLVAAKLHKSPKTGLESAIFEVEVLADPGGAYDAGEIISVVRDNKYPDQAGREISKNIAALVSAATGEPIRKPTKEQVKECLMDGSCNGTEVNMRVFKHKPTSVRCAVEFSA